MELNCEGETEQQFVSDHIQKANSTRPSANENTSILNTNMSDENRDPSSTPVPAKVRPKPIDARSAGASTLLSSQDSPKSATITNVSQRLPSTSVEVSVGDILSTDEKRASVSIREHQPRHSTSSCSSSELGDPIENTTMPTTNKMDLGEATRELTRLLHIGNDPMTNEIILNPNAPDFTPLDFSPTYRSELAPAHLQRRATQVDYYQNRQQRSRHYSESYQQITSTGTSTIRPLLSLVPQYMPYHRQSWSITSPPSTSSSNSWWQHDHSNPPSSSSSSYHSKPAFPLYSPLMPPLTDDSLYPTKNSSRRQRIHSNRAFVFPSQITSNRKRSHSGSETPLQPPPSHLHGIHGLTKMMIDILRSVDPLTIKNDENNTKPNQVQKYRRTSNNYYSKRLQIQQRNDSVDVEDVFVDDEIPSITASLNKSSNLSDENKSKQKTNNDNEQNQSFSLISTNVAVKDTNDNISTHSTTDESSDLVANNKKPSTSNDLSLSSQN